MEDLHIQLVGEVNCPVVSLASSAFEAKRKVLDTAKKIQEVTDFDSLEAAGKALTQLKGLITAVENSRKQVKQPILYAGEMVDGIAKRYCSDLKAEAERIAKIAGAYQEAKKRKEERIQQEAAEKQNILLAELSDRQTARIQEGGDREEIKNDLDTMIADTADQIAETQMDLSKKIGPKLEGLSSRKIWKFEVVDIDVLFKAHPELCIITTNNPAIRAIISINQRIPGLKIWSETKAIARSTPNRYDY